MNAKIRNDLAEGYGFPRGVPTNNWLNSGMNEDRAKAMRRMFLLKRDLSEEVAQLLSSQV